MWFKNLQLYRFKKTFEHDSETLSQNLEKHLFVPCGNHDVSRTGWVPPLGRHGEQLVHSASGYMMICFKREEKLLPASVVNEALEEKVIQAEEIKGEKIPGKRKRLLKEEIVFSLLPKAFTRSTLQFAYIALADGLLVIDAASSNRAEELIDSLREVLGGLELVPVASNSLPIDVMTRWLANSSAAAEFNLGEECELRDNADVSCVIRCKNQDLATPEITNHLKTGMHVSKLALNWQERIEFVLDEKLLIKRLRFSEIIEEQVDELEIDDVVAKFDVEFTIMTLELSAFIKALVAALDGEQPLK